MEDFTESEQFYTENVKSCR